MIWFPFLFTCLASQLFTSFTRSQLHSSRDIIVIFVSFHSDSNSKLMCLFSFFWDSDDSRCHTYARTRTPIAKERNIQKEKLKQHRMRHQQQINKWKENYRWTRLSTRESFYARLCGVYMLLAYKRCSRSRSFDSIVNYDGKKITGNLSMNKYNHTPSRKRSKSHS